MESKIKLKVKKIEYYTCHQAGNPEGMFLLMKEQITEYLEIGNELSAILKIDLSPDSKSANVSYAVIDKMNLSYKKNELNEIALKFPQHLVSLNEYCIDRCEGRKVNFL